MSIMQLMSIILYALPALRPSSFQLLKLHTLEVQPISSQTNTVLCLAAVGVMLFHRTIKKEFQNIIHDLETAVTRVEWTIIYF